MPDETKPRRAVFSIDASLHNADWPKQSWDLLDIDSIDKLRAYLRAQRITPESFMALPIYQHNVERMPWLKELANPESDAAAKPKRKVQKSRGAAPGAAGDDDAPLLEGDQQRIEEMHKSQRILTTVRDQLADMRADPTAAPADVQRLESEAQALDSAIEQTRYRIYGPKGDDA